jgi:HSP20 family protein
MTYFLSCNDVIITPGVAARKCARPESILRIVKSEYNLSEFESGERLMAMMKITKPADDLERWTRDMDRLMNSMFRYETLGAPTVWRPPTDVYETSDLVVIKVEIAGMSPDDFEISFSNRILQIHGFRADRQRKLSYHCLEVPYGEFLSEVYLPGSYAQDQIEAQYDNGFLTVTLPKVAPEAHPIAVHSEET